MACPFFYPLEPMERGRWTSRPDAPLGDGFAGQCRANEGKAIIPGDHIQKEHCNFGYPDSCPYFPKQHPFQAVRFAMTGGNNERMVAKYVLENNRRPYSHGELIYNVTNRRIENPHSNPIIHRQSICYFETFLKKKGDQQG